MDRAEYVRLYSDDCGESHFEYMEIHLTPLDYAPPAAPFNIAQFLPVTQSLWAGFPKGWAGEEPHPSPWRQIFCIMKGEFEVTASDGTMRSFGAGDVLLMEDTTGKGHITHMTADEGLVFALVLGDPQQ